MAQQNILCELEDSQGLLVCDRWKIFQKVVEAIPGFQIINEGFYGHPGPP